MSDLSFTDVKIIVGLVPSISFNKINENYSIIYRTYGFLKVIIDTYK